MSNTVSITQAIRMMKHRLSVNASRAFLLIGPPGVAKTAICSQVAEQLGRKFSSVKIGHKTPEMLGGYPYLEDTETGKVLDFSKPGQWFPTEEDTILLVDEVGQAPVAVQNVIMSLPETGRMGDHSLPKGTSIIMAANGSQHRAGSVDPHTAFRTRFSTVLEIDPEKDEFIEHAMTANFHPMLVSAVKATFEKVVDFDPKNKGGFLTLRTLEQASDALYDYSADATNPDLRACIYSQLGDVHAAALLGFIESYQSLPDYADIIADPLNVTVEVAMSDPIGKLIAGNVKYAHIPKIIRYIARYPDESQAAMISRLPESVSDHPDIVAMQEALALI